MAQKLHKRSVGGGLNFLVQAIDGRRESKLHGKCINGLLQRDGL
jgi:hypothetical protein